MGLFNKIFNTKDKENLEQGIQKTREGFFGKITRAVAGHSKIDTNFLDHLEDILISSDVGIDTSLKIIDRIERRVARDKFINTSELNTILRDEISVMLSEHNTEDIESYRIPKNIKPFVIMVVGVNGVGKTTTIGKLAYRFKQEGYRVLLGAADTFRAAAIDQLQIWADRVDVPLVKKEMGSDPASVAFDTVKSALAKDADIVIIDTAGRLHNKVNLMNELSKVKNVMQKVIPDAPHEVMLVLDASTGQNALEQARHFIKATEVNALTITKLDGTAKGGVILGIADQFSIPVKYIGVGEAMDHLQVFNRQEFIDALFSE